MDSIGNETSKWITSKVVDRRSPVIPHMCATTQQKSQHPITFSFTTCPYLCSYYLSQQVLSEHFTVSGCTPCLLPNY